MMIKWHEDHVVTGRVAGSMQNNESTSPIRGREAFAGIEKQIEGCRAAVMESQHRVGIDA